MQYDASTDFRDTLDEALLAELLPSVDPCGGWGEFHMFVSAGPCFFDPSGPPSGGKSGSIDVSVGEIVEHDNFVYADLLPASNTTHSS